MSLPSRILLTLFLAASISPSAHAATLFVDADAAGSGDGTSWEDAFVDLQDALSASEHGDEIWVAEGTYRPSDAIDPSQSFLLADGVELYGGFAGGEVARAERDWTLHQTTLSGELNPGAPSPLEARPEFDDPGTAATEMYAPLRRWADRVLRQSAKLRAERSDHVLRAEGVGPTTVLDGFTITRGGSGDGAGMLLRGSSPVIRNACFRLNGLNEYGGGLAMYEGSSPSLENVVFEDNSSWWGAGLYAEDSTPTLTNVRFEDNFGLSRMGGADFRGGGGQVRFRNVSFIRNIAGDAGGGFHTGIHLLYEGGTIHGNYAESYDGGGAIVSSPATLLNVLFSSNTSHGAGGGLYGAAGIELINVTFAGNVSGDDRGSALRVQLGEVTVRNSLFWANPTFENPIAISVGSGSLSIGSSLVQGCGGSGVGWLAWLGYDAGGNLDVDPLFLNPEAGDYQLSEESPAIDAGDEGALPAGANFDLAGNSRVFGPTVDIGAYEYQGAVYLPLRSLGELKALFGGP